MEIIIIVQVLCALAVLMTYRNGLIYKIRGQEIDRIGEWWRNDIEAGTGCHNHNNVSEYYFGKFNNGPSYGMMVLDLRKWTYKQFYGNGGKHA